ncbi:L-serine dehydratase, beta subunit [Geomicrobium sp. JCM 19037]|uniref:L-serine ammonia-lyase, iron-sulfur-dependent subunit beta n=1 Tax=unclassified Geomicrobium TaxID=2628951 RepID=UPI00045F14C6|nr:MULTISPECIES: L-serine ammonia-lyase, iron-sulfur-dependent subunit beta [unclassified Geomicrobium]GAK04669.1 L-serine dehydratase, beta subunit [Geomicrobium sp. JCM 19037]GAK10876.1 L-serine dehydratase, beta subunit [Geomicrobium sp. JCM 19039]
MKYRSVTEIIGPIMIGPSSSHTAGAARIGRLARLLFHEQPERVNIHLYGSFAKTYKGHGTDVALIGGLLDFDTFDERIPQAKELAKERKMRVRFHEEDAIMDHPNTVKLRLEAKEKSMELVGISIGGGKIEVVELNGFQLNLSGHHPALLIVHQDRYGVIANVANLLAAHKVNIGHMEVSRKEKGREALMVIEMDQSVTDDMIESLERLEHITQVAKLNE